MMKPILFSTPMVQAILDGRKTMTRRVMKDCTQFDIEEAELLENTGYNLTHNYKMSIESVGIFSTKEKLLNWFVPKYSKYQVGDVLWVRETFSVISGNGETPNSLDLIAYKANDDEQSKIITEFKCWKPSIFMPKEYARIFLRVTNVRVERLQDISEEDCLAEGIYESDDNDCTGKYKAYTIKKPTIESGVFIDDKFNSAYEAFEWLWNSINGKGAWEDNPYVFVYEFERVEKPKDTK